MTKTLVLVLAWNGERFLRPCLDALQRQDYADKYGVLVVDNASSDASREIARSYEDVALIESDYNRGFAGGNNLGLRAVRDGKLPASLSFQPDVVVLLNQDTEVSPDWLTEIDRVWARHPAAGIVGCKAYEPDGRTVQHAGGTLLWPLGTGRHRGAGEADIGQYDDEAEVEFVTGAAMALRCELLQHVGLLDEGYTPAYYEDVDYCYRARAAGYQVIYAPGAHLLHHEGTSLGLRSANHQRAYHRNRVRFLLKWCSLHQLEHDWLEEEHADMRRWSTGDSLARKYAYARNLMALHRTVALRTDAADPPDTYERLARMLAQVHRATVEEEARERATSYAVDTHTQQDTV